MSPVAGPTGPTGSAGRDRPAGRAERRAARRDEPLARARRVAPTLYVLILIGASLLLILNHEAWLAAVLVGCHLLMIGAIVLVARQPEDPWTGPRLRRPKS